MSSAILRVGACILAAGRSQRMGAENKLLAPVEGQPMVARVAAEVVAAGVAPVVVVTGHEAPLVEDAVSGLAVTTVRCADFALGMSRSLRAGITALEGQVDGAFVCLADMPWIRADHLRALTAVFDPEGARPICAPFVGERRGHPVLWPSADFPRLKQLTGDRGARDILEQEAERVTAVALDDEAITWDVDLRSDLARTPHV